MIMLRSFINEIPNYTWRNLTSPFALFTWDFWLGRRISFLRIALVLMIVLQWQLSLKLTKYRGHFKRDFEYCPHCFEPHYPRCIDFLNSLEYADTSTAHFLYKLVAPKAKSTLADYLVFKNKEKSPKILAKYVTDAALSKMPKLWISELRNLFFNETYLEGIHFCQQNDMRDFIRFLTPHTDCKGMNSVNCTLAIWFHMVMDISPLLSPALIAEGFPVPKVYPPCGLTTFQEYAGQSITSIMHLMDYNTRLDVAKQLLEAAIKFTNGINGYRIYLTDFNFDNVVYNFKENKIYFVDLDTVMIVDSKSLIRSNPNITAISKFYPLECYGCLAYYEKTLCSLPMTDINIYAVCQLLVEDRFENAEKGLIHPIPPYINSTYPKLIKLLVLCRDCPDQFLPNRFIVAEELIKTIKEILS